MAQYMAELRRLSEHCDFRDYLSEALRDRLVCGLRSEAIQRRLLSQKDRTLETAYDIALSEETASQRASELQASVKTSTSSEGDVWKVAPGKPHNGKGTAQSCYRCGKSGHTPDHCFYKHQKCRVCQKKGHIAKVCRNADKGAPYGTSSPGGSPKTPNHFETTSQVVLIMLILKLRSPRTYSRRIMMLNYSHRPHVEIHQLYSSQQSMELNSRWSWIQVPWSHWHPSEPGRKSSTAAHLMSVRHS